MEALSGYIWKELSSAVLGTGVDRMAVAVEETEGMLCWYEEDIIAEGERNL